MQTAISFPIGRPARLLALRSHPSDGPAPTPVQLTAVDGLPGAEAARKLGMPVAHVFVAKHRIQKMLQEEVHILKDGGG